ncbi:MAG: putative peptidoglycan glycosyltransferase FtsW [Caulobacter sp.]|nr:putative peptidoglycan glycosyltransferase FtsW [Caulobacter sp.]
MNPNQHLVSRTKRTPLANWWWTVDHSLLAATGILIVLGVLLSFTSSPAAAVRLRLDDPLHFAVRQCLFAAGACGLVVLVSILSSRGIKRAAFFIYLGAILVMAALPFLGHEAKGATRWIAFAGFTLQPSEFLKPALIVLVAWMFSEGQKGQGVPGVSIAFGFYFTAVGLLIIQPDVGQTILITIAFGAAFWMAGVPISWIPIMGGSAAAGLGAIYLLLPHARSRVDRFLSPEGADTHQITKASEAIANGGLFGRGPGEGVMKQGVPDLQTDFIYSVAAEEYGLVFSLALIGVFAFLMVRGLYRSMKLSDSFEQVAAAGLFVLVGQQALINMAVNLNMAPTKGMTLPFISYGGSSMLAMGLTMGMALGLTRRRPGAFDQADSAPLAGAFA